MDDYNNLSNQRNFIIDRIKKISTSADAAKGNASKVPMFKTRFTSLEGSYTSFEKISDSIVKILSSGEELGIDKKAELKKEKKLRDDIDETYWSIKSIYVSLFGDLGNNNTNSHNVRLPKLTVPIFDGQINDWSNWYELFNSLIHENNSISAIEKFQYLISSLKGDPLAIVKKLPVVGTNYPIALKELTDRYQNTRRLVSGYWNEIYNLPSYIPDNASSIRGLLNTLNENLSALETLQMPVEEWSFLLFDLIYKKLDKKLCTKFEDELESKDKVPEFGQLKDFLTNHCLALENIESASNKSQNSNNGSQCSSKNNSNFNSQNKRKLNTLVAGFNNNLCTLCKNANHKLYLCPQFLKKEPHDRYVYAKQNNLCLNCLSSSHMVQFCTSSYSCRCGKKHSHLLHFVKNSTSSKNIPSNDSIAPNLGKIDALPSISGNNSGESSATNLFSDTENYTVLLSTLQINVLDATGNPVTVRCILDSGSQINVVTNSLVQKLKLNSINSTNNIQGLSNLTLRSNGMTNLTVLSPDKQIENIKLQAVILPKVCSEMPQVKLSSKNWDYIKNLKLADPTFDIPGPIDVLLGNPIFALILRDGKIEGGKDQPVALNTIFGYILLGHIPIFKNNNFNKNSLFTLLDDSLENIMSRFWQSEELPKHKIIPPEDISAEESFERSFSRNKFGRFSLALPFKGDEPTFENSKMFAIRRFKTLERHLEKDNELKLLYNEFMLDYLKSGHMSLLENPIETPKSYYIPHFAILKDSVSTRLRTVFDASQKDCRGVSLNDTLLVGPKLHKEIPDIMLTFRLHPVVFIADLRQMYRNIEIHFCHRDYQRILFRFSPNDPIKTYRLNTVVYGLSSSPYQALKVIQKIVELDGKEFPLASEVLKRDNFMDDIVSGASNVDLALKTQKELISLLGRSCFNLHKWISNEPLLLKNVENVHPVTHTFDQNSLVKILGVGWQYEIDKFSYKIKIENKPPTKRNVLSQIAKIYDPLGWLSPVVFYAKHFMQVLWTRGLEWDETLPNDLVKYWETFINELPFLSSITIDRYILVENYKSIELHGFADASLKGIGAAVFFRLLTSENKYISRLVMAKSKVNPLKVTSIPRLELQACVLLSDLIKYVVETCKPVIKIDKIYAWSDSAVALCWIKNPPYKWQTYVANRVAHIQELVPPERFAYVETNLNVADASSRGMLPRQFLNYREWFTGPSFLTETEINLVTPQQVPLPNSQAIEKEQRRIVLTNIVENNIFDNLLNKYSSLFKIKRILAYVKKFIDGLKNKNKNVVPLTTTDLNSALYDLVKHVQASSFESDIKNISNHRLCCKPLRKLCPFIDDRGLCRVGGRLVNAKLSYEQKFPLLLPKNHRFTELLIQEVHKNYLHVGVQTCQYIILQHFWILSAKQAIRRVIGKCLTCFRANPVPLTPLMGNLPSSRVNQVKPFSHVGVDFGGPFHVKMSKLRGSKSEKAYICLFVCFATKALHLEVASDLSSDCFLAALRRFVSRRGRIDCIYSDNATNFRGAYKHLVSLMREAVNKEMVTWRYNPPSAANQGGLWENSIKAVKTLLLRVVGEQILTYEEFYTVLTQIEAVLNSRPLCPISSDPADLSVLSPGHFLTLAPLSALPDQNFDNIKINRLSRWQMIQKIQQDFWNRFKNEYLHTLTQRHKWNKNSNSLAIGDMVLIKDENSSPLNWRVGRVTDLFPGTDGIVRVVNVRTVQGVLKRPLVKLCPLPKEH